MEQIAGKLGQLASAEQRLRLNDVRHIYFGVAMLLAVHIDHELGQGAMQAGNLALQHHKAGAGDARGGLKVDAASQRFAQIHMVLDREIELARRAATAYFDVVVLVFAHRHRQIRQVRNAQRNAVEFSQHLVQLDLGGLQLIAKARHLGQQRRHIFTPGFGLANRLGAGVALVLQLLGFDLQYAALLLKGVDTRHVEGHATGGEALGGLFNLLAQVLGIEHERLFV